MQFFNFIFLARSWASDRHYLVKELAAIGRRAEQTDIPLTFILYPEGTLVSKDTRPISKKYADKIGIVSGVILYSLVTANGRYTAGHGPHSPSEIDWPALQSQGTVTADTEFAAHRHHCRIPRSVQFYFELSAMCAYAHVHHSGIPPMGYGQAYYTLRSIFWDRVPPPAVHMHIRRFDVAKDVPIGDVSKTNPTVLPTTPSNGSAKLTALEADVPEVEKDKFDVWLRELWLEKDKVMSRYLETGTMSPALEKEAEVVIPVKLRHNREILEAFVFFVPALAGYFGAKLKRLVP